MTLFRDLAKANVPYNERCARKYIERQMSKKELTRAEAIAVTMAEAVVERIREELK